MTKRYIVALFKESWRVVGYRSVQLNIDKGTCKVEDIKAEDMEKEVQKKVYENIWYNKETGELEIILGSPERYPQISNRTKKSMTPEEEPITIVGIEDTGKIWYLDWKGKLYKVTERVALNRALQKGVTNVKIVKRKKTEYRLVALKGVIPTIESKGSRVDKVFKTPNEKGYITEWRVRVREEKGKKIVEFIDNKEKETVICKYTYTVFIEREILQDLVLNVIERDKVIEQKYYQKIYKWLQSCS